MKMVLLAAVAALSIAAPAFADGGNHNGNNNSGTLTGNLNGSLSGNNLNSRSRSAATANNSYQGYQGIDGSGNSTNANNTTFKERYQAPGIAAPGLTSGGNTCAGSWGLGLSGPGVGISGGRTYTMTMCEARTTADQLYRYGMKRVAIQVLYDEHPMVRRAMDIQRQAGAGVPSKKRKR